MRSPIALAALSLFSFSGLAAADPFATRRAPTDAPPAAAPAPAPEAHAVAVSAEDDWFTRRTGAWIFAGTSLALSVSTIALGFYERDRYENAETEAEAQDAKNVLRYTGTTLLATSAVTLGVAIYLYATSSSSSESRPRTVVAPIASRDQVGVGFAHSF
jgi:hypothetical protein